ncbi:MAG TPA: MBL fold metallo-hydrolase [Tepidisphaeraceae bacterium]
MPRMKKPFLQDDAFLADVAACRDDHSDALRLWWLGQSGFLMQCHGRHVLFDPYLSDSLTKKYAGTAKPHVRISERVIAPERLDFIDIITSTHGHTDHLDAETLVPICRAVQARWISMGNSAETAIGPHLLYAAANDEMAWERLQILDFLTSPMDAWEQREVCKIEFTAVPAAHDTIQFDADGYHLYLGYVCRYRSRTIYHSGDTVVYDGMVENLRGFSPIDVAILPINGKVGNMSGRDAARLAKDIGARIVIPCHYDMFEFNTADPADEFIPECERLGQPYRVLQQGERFSSTELPA